MVIDVKTGKGRQWMAQDDTIYNNSTATDSGGRRRVPIANNGMVCHVTYCTYHAMPMPLHAIPHYSFPVIPGRVMLWTAML